jgi:hypothetical protein
MNNLTDKQKELLLSNKEDLKAIVMALWKTKPLSFHSTDEEDFDSFASQFTVEPEWKILLWENNAKTLCNFEKTTLCDIIKTVQYKSETLTVGDDTDKGKIERFEVGNHFLKVWCSRNTGETWFNISEVKKIERKILTTYDCVSIYKHFQFVYSLDTKDYATKWKLTAGEFLKDYGLLDYVLCFSTEEIRDGYVLLNSPKLSVNEVMEELAELFEFGYFPKAKDLLINLIKSKP